MTTTIFYAILSAPVFCASLVVWAGILEAANPSREWESENAFPSIEPIKQALDGTTFPDLTGSDVSKHPDRIIKSNIAPSREGKAGQSIS